ncbi:hypothetical protein ABZZ04_05360 [Streptomyces sp. NPDC006435]|uniref:hypothetical protein n=1 Tax=Streptomyces sp. NPDC006435 TaxID=3154300 RepID=UPI0033AB028A
MATAARGPYAEKTAIRLYRSADGDDQSVGDLFASHLDLARGHMLLGDLGDLGGTEEMLDFVLAASPERMSASIVRRLTVLGMELEGPQYGGAAQAVHLRERLQHTAVRASLPAAHPPELPT